MNAVVYTSNTGYTAQYADLLGKLLQLPVLSLEEAKSKLKQDAQIIYLGWLMAGQIKGYKQAAKKFNIAAVCAVGMGACGTQLEEARKTNGVPQKTMLFTLQGGFDLNRLHGIYGFMMRTMKKTLGKKLERKPDKTQDETDMLDLLNHGGNRVSEENLNPVLNWYEQYK